MSRTAATGESFRVILNTSAAKLQAIKDVSPAQTPAPQTGVLTYPQKVTSWLAVTELVLLSGTFASCRRANEERKQELNWQLLRSPAFLADPTQIQSVFALGKRSLVERNQVEKDPAHSFNPGSVLSPSASRDQLFHEHEKASNTLSVPLFHVRKTRS